MNILEESFSSNLSEPSSLYSTERYAEIRKTDEVEEIIRYMEQNTSLRNLIEQHSRSDSHVSPEECQEFIRPINDNDDSEVSLASLQVKMSYMRKIQGEYVPFHIFLQNSGKRSDQWTINSQNPVPNPHEPLFPVYISSLFYLTLARPLTYIEFMKLTFSTLLRLYEKTRIDLHEILESIRKNRSPAQLEDRCHLSIEEARTIETTLSNDIQEFFKNSSRCETLRRHFVDVILDDFPFEFESFKREHLLRSYLEHLLCYSEYLANRIISSLYEYLEKKHELSLCSKKSIYY